MGSWSESNDAATSTQEAHDLGQLSIRLDVSFAPLSLLSYKAMVVLMSFSANCANFQVLFYLPIYFQSVKGDSAIMSGVYTLPFVCFYALGSMLSGAWIGKMRLPIAVEIVSPLLALVGAILFFYMDVDSTKAWYIGAQIPFGLGIGLGSQAPVTALQALAKPSEVAATMGIIFSE